jgi:endonuclease/exonuclease/phosphatase family metal-dependent hydrolase
MEQSKRVIFQKIILSQICNILLNYAPDIFGLQEATYNQVQNIESFLGDNKLNYKWVGEGSFGDQKGEHVPIFVNSDIFDIVESGTFWLSPEPSHKVTKYADSIAVRICTWAKVGIKKNKSSEDDTVVKEFIVCNTHWDQNREARRQSALTIRDKMEDATNIGELLCIALGDFNCAQNSNNLKILGTGFDEVAVKITPKEENVGESDDDEDPQFKLIHVDTLCGSENKFTKLESFVDKKITIDHILLSQEFVVKNYHVVDVPLASAHRPVISDLIIV